YAQAQLAEGQQWLDALLEAASDQEVPPAVLGTALLGDAHLAGHQLRIEESQRLLDRGLEILRAIDDTRGIGMALRLQGLYDLSYGNRERARALLEEAISRFQPIGETWARSMAYRHLGMLARSEGDIE